MLSGWFLVLLCLVPACSTPRPSKSVRMEFNADTNGVSLNGDLLNSPCSREELTTVLGRPDRETTEPWCCDVWDDLGLVAVQTPADRTCHTLVFRMDDCHLVPPADSLWPRHAFKGELSINGEHITGKVSVEKLQQFGFQHGNNETWRKAFGPSISMALFMEPDYGWHLVRPLLKLSHCEVYLGPTRQDSR